MIKKISEIRRQNLKKANAARKKMHELKKSLTESLMKDMPDALDDAASREMAKFLKKQTKAGREEIFRNMVLELAIGQERTLKQMLKETGHPDYLKLQLGLMRVAASLSEAKTDAGKAQAGVIVNISGLNPAPIQVSVEQNSPPESNGG